MRRRSVLLALAGVGSAGCLSAGGGDTEASPTAQASPTAPTKPGTETPVRRTADGLTATFRVVDSHRPTPDDASATFGDGRVTVVGTVDPAGCNRPTLAAVGYDAADALVRLRIGTTDPYVTATVECGNASFDYRSVIETDGGDVDAVEVVHDYEGAEDRSFVLDRD